MVKEGKFYREDLFIYRLNVVPITIPPLRDRKDDLLQLCEYFLGMFNDKYRTDKVLHATTIHEILDYSWPGNVRELENLLERLVITTENRIIYPSALPFHQRNSHSVAYEQKKRRSREQAEKLTRSTTKCGNPLAEKGLQTI